MNEQEMQFADPEWKPIAGNPLQDEDRTVQNVLPRVEKGLTYDNTQSTSAFSAYEQGYQGNQRQLPPIPYIAPVSSQTQIRPAPRRRSRLWIWIIIAVVAIYMFGGMSSFRSNNYSASPYQQGMPSYHSHISSYSVAGISRLHIDNTSGSIQVQVEGSGNDEVIVNSTTNDNVTATDGKGLMSISLHGDATITLPSDIAVSLELTSNAGDIVVSNYQGELSASNSDHSIFLNDSQITGKSIIHSGSGEIHVNQSGIHGTSALTSDSGNIALDNVDLNGDVTVSTGGEGSISLDGTLDQQGKYHFSTENGDLDLALPPDTSLHVNVSKGKSGQYQNDFDNNGSTTPPTSVDVKTDSGAITIHQQ